MSSAAYTAQRQIIDKAKTLPKKGGRLVRRGIVGAIGGGTAAMLAAGIAATTGDAGKAMTMIGAAGMAGASFTNYYGDKIAKAAGKDLDAARVGFWGSDYKQVQQAKFDKAILKSPELVDKLTQALGRKNARLAIDDGSVQALLNNNITDPGKIAKALALKERIKKRPGYGDDDKALQHAVALAMWDRDVNPAIFNNFSRENTIFRENLFRKFQAQGESEASASNLVDQIMKDLLYFES